MKMPKKDEYVQFKKFEKKKKKKKNHHLRFMQILKVFQYQKTRESNILNIYTNKYQKHVACSNDYKLICVDDNFSKHFKSCLGEDAVYNLSIV